MCDVGVPSEIMCGRASEELTVSSTARNAGAETLAGDSLGPGLSTNVAGTRALVDPPLMPEPPLGRVCVLLRCMPTDGELVAALMLEVVDARPAVEVVVVVVVVELGAAFEEVAMLEPELLDPPQPPSRSTVTRAKNEARPLTFSA